VIQTTLFFILGFLCAAFLALMVAPAVWRRAVALTRKRIEASVPLTMDEIQADKDRMRAEFAMATRRLEMSVKSFKEKAAGQIVEINRNREELKRIAEERDERNRTVTDLEARASELRAELKQREDTLQRHADKLAELEQRLEEKALELDRLGRMYDEASFNASSRQIDLVAQETKMEKLSEDVVTLRNERKEADGRVREMAAELKEARDALRAERKKAVVLEKKAERLTASLAEREEKLERREKELSRFRDQVKDGGTQERRLSDDIGKEQAERVRLEGEVADLTGQLSRLISGATAGDLSATVAKLEADRQRVEERIAVLTRENRKLTAELADLQRVHAEDWGEERRGSAVLREQINDLAAEVVALTATLDGPESPIHAALKAGGSKGQGVSLADRVRALQKAAAAAR
jgi:chromosome segregation ATPase